MRSDRNLFCYGQGSGSHLNNFWADCISCFRAVSNLSTMTSPRPRKIKHRLLHAQPSVQSITISLFIICQLPSHQLHRTIKRSWSSTSTMAETTIYQACTASIDEADIGSLLKCVAEQAQQVSRIWTRVTCAIAIALMCSYHVNVKYVHDRDMMWSSSLYSFFYLQRVLLTF